MESVIYYFSATGNSLRIANIMAERMDGLLLPMSKYKGTKCSSRQIGLVFPTYFWGVPRTVAEFVDEMKVEADNQYVFAAATCGGLAGGVLGHLDALLKKKGLHLDYGITIPSVANFIEEYNPKTRSADRKLREADEMAERASAEVIAARRNGPFGFHVWESALIRCAMHTSGWSSRSWWLPGPILGPLCRQNPWTKKSWRRNWSHPLKTPFIISFLWTRYGALWTRS